MIKSALSSAGALLLGGVAFVVLYPILGVTLWVSLLATAGVLIVASAASYAAAPLVNDSDGRLSLNPIVDVTVLRGRYAATLAAALIAGFTVVETFAFGGAVRQWIGFGLGVGIVGLAGAGLAVSMVRRGAKQRVSTPALRLPVWDLLASLAIGVGAWQIVQTLVFSGATAKWLTFSNGCLLEALALAGLVVHELSTERVVHALEVVGSAIDEGRHDAGSREHAMTH